MISRRTFLIALVALSAYGQDSLKVASPSGRIEFRVGVILPPEPGSFLRLAYSVSMQGKPVLDTSYLGFWIHNQEPILGENLGLSDSKRGQSDGYNWVMGEFLQNGSLGRRINVEARVYEDKVAFRYVIPRTAALEDLFIESEETEFRFAGVPELPARSELPFILEQPGVGWIAIAEGGKGSYARTTLARRDSRTMVTSLAVDKEGLAVSTTSPFTTPWRVIAIGASRKQVEHTDAP